MMKVWKKYSNKTAGAEFRMQLIELKNGCLAKKMRRKMKVFFRTCETIAACKTNRPANA